MLMPASPEFVALCRSQITLLNQALGASLSVVYLTEELPATVNANLIPVAAYPEAMIDWEPERVLSLLSLGIRRSYEEWQRLYPDSASFDERDAPGLLANYPRRFDAEQSPLQQQIVLPLIHEGGMMGLLITARSDRAWSDREQAQVEHIADTLSIACVLDQRSQWADRDLHQQYLLRSQQRDVFDDLLHQFRNPLTALRTFGKLLLKRFLPNDPNRDVAAGIVRESDRLQELLKEFDQAINLGEAEPYPLLPAESSTLPSYPGELRGSNAEASRLLPSSPHFLTGAALHTESYAITDVLAPLLSSAEVIAQDRQLTLKIFLPTRSPTVKADLRALREVLSNLIDNALKYTPSGGTVYVWTGNERAGAAGMMEAIAIADTGPGIPEQDLEHLFERHYRGIQAQTDIPGSGLGLAIAQDLVTQMQGDIQVVSPARASQLPNPFQDELEISDRPGTLFLVWLPA